MAGRHIERKTPRSHFDLGQTGLVLRRPMMLTHFPVDTPVPTPLVEKLVRVRMAQAFAQGWP